MRSPASRIPDRRQREPTEKRHTRSQRLDRRAAAVVTAIALAAFTFVSLAVEPVGPIAWSPQLLLLWLIVAIGAGRALLGFQKPSQEVPHPRFPLSTLHLWPALATAAALPYLHGLT
ncbi:MAG: hypothetical protein JSV79_10140, partial [Armatimonadota bacterium]